VKTLKRLAPALVLLAGYALVVIGAGLYDIRFAIGVLGVIAIYEGREAGK
jgi:hypothetical protein